MKTRIVEHLGHGDILLPSLVAEGLSANDRIKVRLTALQAAAQRARDPAQEAIDLTAECRAAGLDPRAIQPLVNGARLAADGRIVAPELAVLREGLAADMTAMIRALEAGTPEDGRLAAERFRAIRASGVLADAADIDPAEVADLTRVSDGDRDSLHRLVMDLHKALNRLAAGCAEETLAGARAYGLLPDDRPAVESFMRGVAATRALKFDHPGLDTMAMRSGPRLTIQNDIGATDAHVVVIVVEGNVVTVTYTDVHRARARFFAELLDGFPVHWSGLERQRAEGLGDEEVFHLVTGRYDAGGGARRDAFLEAVGANLVFLIDWNKARKVLRAWVPKQDAVRLLDWAARNRIGHRGFLELGGGDLVAAAVRHATPTRIGFGERLDAVLGRDQAVDFLKSVVRTSTEALLEGQSIRLARDRIEADLVRHLKRANSALLAFVVRQAGLARDIAAALSQHLAERRSGQPGDGAALAAQARRIEEKADRLALEARNEIARFAAGPTLERLVDRVEETIDELEQAAFIASLVPPGADPALFEPLVTLGAAAVSGAETAASGIDAMMEVPEGRRADSEDVLAAVGRLADLEHGADDAERRVTALVLQSRLDAATCVSMIELARAIERATDRLAAFGHLMRQHVLAELSP